MTSPAADSRVRGILDSSAIQSYARGHIHVGEVMSEIATEHAYVGIPATALLDAHSRNVDDEVARARLGVLVTLPGAQMMKLDAETAAAVADVVPYVGEDLARAHAAWAALHHAAILFTTEPHKSGQAMSEDRIIAIPTEDA